MSVNVNEQLGDDELVARCAIFPEFAPRDEGGSRAFDYKKLIYLRKLKGDSKIYALSVGWRLHLPSASDVHAYGCRQAANGNLRKAEKLGNVPQPVEQAQHYLGFYDVVVGDAVSASCDIYCVAVDHCPENGEIAHSHLTLNERDNVDQNTPKGVHRTKILDALWRMMKGPERHICECDAEQTALLANIDLPLRPS